MVFPSNPFVLNFMPHSIAVAILALNEEQALRLTYETYKRSIIKKGLDYEFIIINDGSSDRTGEIAESIKEENSMVTIIHNDQSLGMGNGYKQGLRCTEKEYFMYTGGYCALTEEYIDLYLEGIGVTDITIGHIANPEFRAPLRRTLSAIFTGIMNLITGLNLKYYNAMCLCRTDCLKNITIRSQKYTFQAECLAKLLKFHQCTYREISIVIRKRQEGKSRAMKWKNFLDTGKFFCFLLYDYYRLSKNPTQVKTKKNMAAL